MIALYFFLFASRTQCIRVSRLNHVILPARVLPDSDGEFFFKFFACNFLLKKLREEAIFKTERFHTLPRKPFCVQVLCLGNHTSANSRE